MTKVIPFAQQIKYERERCGWSQEDLASHIGCSPKTIARWESNKGFPRPEYRRLLCKTFQKSAEALGLLQPPTAFSQTQEETFSTPALLPSASYHSILGLPPPTNAKTIQQREHVVSELFHKLSQPDISAIVITGIGGVGKSTLAALVYQYALTHYQANTSIFTAAPLWLTVNETVTFADILGTLFEALGKALPNLGNLTPHNQAMLLFHTLNSVRKTRLIVIDQFEQVLDWQTGYARSKHPAIATWLDILNSQPSTCKFLLTSRPSPKGTHAYPPTSMQDYPATGLATTEGIELLRKQGIETLQATHKQLQSVVRRCDGHALALSLLASLLRQNRSLNLTLLFEESSYATLWSGDIARNLLDYIYQQQITEKQQILLSAFSIYREAVPLDAALALIDLPQDTRQSQILSSLSTLLTQYLLQATGNGRYQLHAIVTDYVHEHFIDAHFTIRLQALQKAHFKASRFYLEWQALHGIPREQRQNIHDVQFITEALWHLCQAEYWSDAYMLLQHEELYTDLRRWGGNTLLLELYQFLLPFEKWQPTQTQQAEILDHMGRIYGTLGKKKQALHFYEQALQIYTTQEDVQGEGRVLNHLASVYGNLGETALAKQFHEQAFLKVRQGGDRKGEADSLNGLAWICSSLGEKETALHYYQQALHIRREIGHRVGEGDTLMGLGLLYQAQGENMQALAFLQQSLRIRREAHDRGGEGRTLNQLGLLYIALGQDKQAIGCYKKSLRIRKEIGDRNGEGVLLYNIGKLYLQRNDYEQAHMCMLSARDIFREVQNTYQHAAQRWIDTLHTKTELPFPEQKDGLIHYTTQLFQE